MNENITKATQTVWFLESDILAAYSESIQIERPEGRTVGDKAMTAYLADCLSDVRALQNKLAVLS